jgi:thiol:disulfide interchange protein
VKVARAHLAGLLAVTALGTAQIVLRLSPEPAAAEIVAWEPYSALGSPPYAQPVLLEFSADWCPPCRRMQVTTFRDPAFASLIARGLRPVRVESTDEEFFLAMTRYGVGDLPALVLIDLDGRFTRVARGVVDAASLEWRVDRGIERLRRALFWNEPSFLDREKRRRPTVLAFQSAQYLDVRRRTDWREHPSAAFAAWCTAHLDLVEADLIDHHGEGAELYRRWNVGSVPTLVVLDAAGREVGRFEGTERVRAAPGEIARLARESGIEIPDAPRPYARGE